ncbi:DNA-binding protein BIN4 [Alnus glutinosa]|uniref:DNA-binding protein BIN4 n=1 Tax=Alnus glutinosa TaxID=3517 RepID=UPI002D791901|nr:DNA-binding protein BIN4 [Alnus glutinosa]XP_062147457.1 DNA-binding protein BIN4 [Alnus glutinosa]
MSSSREESPDWLRSFQAPSHSVLTVSSDSQSSLKDSPSREDRVDVEEPSPRKSSKITKKGKNQAITLGESGSGSPSNMPSKAKSPKKRLKVEDQTPQQKKNTANKKRKAGDESDKTVAKEVTLEKRIEPHEPNDSLWALSSDSESGRDNSPVMEDHIHHAKSSNQKTSEFQGGANGADVVLIGSDLESPSKKASKKKYSRKRLKVDDHTPVKEEKINENMERKGNVDNVEVAEEETSDKHIEPHVSSSRLPLVLSEKVHRSKALVECEGDSIDLSGDMGAVGRVVISDAPSGNHDMYLDLKGTIYKTTIVPSRTFCIVSFGQSEAKIEAIMNDFIQLKPQSNVYEAETMVEGTLEGFSFDSEDEADKMPKAVSHQNEDVEEQANGKTKGKPEKTSGIARKRGKTAGGKPQAPKRVRKKNQVSKKAKTKK